MIRSDGLLGSRGDSSDPLGRPFGASLGPFEPIFLTTQTWASDFAFKADKLCRGQMHYKFCPSPRADALQVLFLSEG